MTDSPAFQKLCDAIEAATSLDRLESRGTVRLALREAGLDAGRVSPAELAVVVQQILPAELEARGIDPQIVSQLADVLNEMSDATIAAPESPETVFGRIH